ncbi:MAG: ferritin [Gemmatimonadetes bacterium]|jgi:ferritin|nr:ferritin [Gemmatimonadota bacterium]MBT6149707.1 ferritin [Gemmatimonadota bacterium]MBT7863594.1 ferritin [Gemmatimonadota bacterium]
MLTQSMQDALNRQINVEFASAHQYLALSSFFEQLNMKGCAHWMRLQHEEERAHGMKIFDYLHDRDGVVKMLPIEAPETGWKTALDGFQSALQSERYNSEQIGNLVALATTEGDHPTHAFMQWFVTEQVEEEATAKEIVDKMTFVGDDRTGQFIIDQELAQRTPPPEVQTGA